MAERESMNGVHETEAIEVCPHCGFENHYMIDVISQHYTAKCKRCKKTIMLCDECMHATDNKNHRCDWSEKTGCFRNTKEAREEYMNPASYWRSVYFTELEKRLNLDRKFTFTCDELRTVKNERDKLANKCDELEKKYAASVSASCAMKELYDERTKEFIDAQKRIDNCKKWMKAMKKEAAIHGRA